MPPRWPLAANPVDCSEKRGCVSLSACAHPIPTSCFLCLQPHALETHPSSFSRNATPIRSSAPCALAPVPICSLVPRLPYDHPMNSLRSAYTFSAPIVPWVSSSLASRYPQSIGLHKSHREHSCWRQELPLRRAVPRYRPHGQFLASFPNPTARGPGIQPDSGPVFLPSSQFHSFCVAARICL